jgi:ABC-type nitrate/sulfonate/bicarbonate transport system substrate-binding protein
MATLERKWLVAVVVVLMAVAGWLFVQQRTDRVAIRVGISPYQDLAMIVTAEPLGLEAKYGTEIDLVTMAWEDILPAVGSAGRAVDIGFGSYIEYLTKYENINPDATDPILFVYPAYVFKGGTFVTYNPAVPQLDKAAVEDPQSESVRRWLEFRIGAQRGSVYEMMLFRLASTHAVPFDRLNVIDTPLEQGFLAAEQRSLDIATAGLTQLTEAQRRGARAVLTMDDVGFADITGFIVKKSVYDQRQRDIHNVIRMWFDSVAFVLSDIDRNSKQSLAYLDKNASTRYTLEEYKRALSQEYFPRTMQEAQAQLIDRTGRFPARAIGETTGAYLVQKGTSRKAPPLPTFADLSDAR